MNTGPGSSFGVTEAYRRLYALELLPPKSEFSLYRNAKSPAEGLLALWKEWLRQAPSSRRSRAARIHSSLHAAVANGAELTFKIPGRGREVCESWLGKRAYWWPDGVSKSSRVGIVASRLKRDPDLRAPVLRALRLSMTSISPSEQVLVSEGTSLCDYVGSCARTLQIPCLRILAADGQTSSNAWLDELISRPGTVAAPQLLLSPDVTQSIVDVPVNPDSVESNLVGIPIRDRVLALMSQRLFVLSLRRRGNWWNLIQAGISDCLWQPGAVRVATGRGLCSDDVVSELQSQGAVRWYLSADKERSVSSDMQSESVSSVFQVEEAIAPCHKTDTEDDLVSELTCTGANSQWLVHWTRTPQGEWAGESREEFLADVVQGDANEARTAFGTLQRIVEEQIIRATSGNTRAGCEVVCLTGAPLTELVQQRVYRKHRGRWDFEYYGVGVRVDLVRSIGGRPVFYGDEATWQSLPEGERAWFQPQSSGLANSRKSIDWTVENEWRVTADLRLEKLPVEDVFFFCATEAEAASLRNQCEWRVVSIEQLKQTMQSPVDFNE